MIEKDPDEWISNLKESQNSLNEFELKGSISDGDFMMNKLSSSNDFMIDVLNNLPEKYGVILDGLENHLTSRGNDASTI